jgi:hypothetical protein
MKIYFTVKGCDLLFCKLRSNYMRELNVTVKVRNQTRLCTPSDQGLPVAGFGNPALLTADVSSAYCIRRLLLLPSLLPLQPSYDVNVHESPPTKSDPWPDGL